MPLFNNRKRAGSGAGEHIHVGHPEDPFSNSTDKASINDEYNRKLYDLKASNPGKVKLEESPFAPKSSALSRGFGNLKEQTKLYKKGKLNPPSTPDPFDY
jgi:hypothetical protein